MYKLGRSLMNDLRSLIVDDHNDASKVHKHNGHIRIWCMMMVA